MTKNILGLSRFLKQVHSLTMSSELLYEGFNEQAHDNLDERYPVIESNHFTQNHLFDDEHYDWTQRAGT